MFLLYDCNMYRDILKTIVESVFLVDVCACTIYGIAYTIYGIVCTIYGIFDCMAVVFVHSQPWFLIMDIFIII